MKKPINKNTEDRIINVASEFFAKNGFDGASIRDICKKADVNISMISYYFGGKKELYEKIVNDIVMNIINFMKDRLELKELPQSFDGLSREEKIEFLYKALNNMIDYFYSDNISDNSIMIFFREQITSGVPLNAMGYNIFRKLLASIFNRDERDKEIIFRCITIVGQLHSARVFKQFSLNMMNQKEYTKEDVELFRKVLLSQVRFTLEGLLSDEK